MRLRRRRRARRAAIFAFDELPGTMIKRCTELGMDIQAQIEQGRLILQQLDPAEISPGEFASKLIEMVDGDPGFRVVVIDSLNGFMHAMTGERETVLHLHELLAYLNTRGVITLITLAQHGVIGNMHSQVDVSYLADAIILLRYFESAGGVRKAMSVVKNRTSQHEHTIRELCFENGSITVGDPLTDFEGVLTGVPTARNRIYMAQKGEV